MTDRIGVGFLGAGPVTQAIHLPTLARLTDVFRVAKVMDVSENVARSVAARVDASFTTGIDALLADPDVDVIAICSPHQFHAEQVIAACRAGKKAVLCEKPFATTGEQARSIAAVSVETGVPILVGAMHAYDPGWLAAKQAIASAGATAQLIRSSIVLPPNARFEDFATEVITRPAPATPDFDDPEVVAGVVSAGVMGLAIHDLPLVRSLLTDWRDLEVLSSSALAPFGYSIVCRSGDQVVELHALMSQNWAPSWHLQVFSAEQVATVGFTPSYVHAGSAVARIETPGLTTVHGPTDYNGYEGEWHELAKIVSGAAPAIEAADLIDDLKFALSIAELAAHRARTSTTAVPG